MNLKKHSQVKSQNFQFWPFSPIPWRHSPIARRARVSTRLGSTSIFRALPSPRAAFIFHLQPALSILRHFPFRSFDRFFSISLPLLAVRAHPAVFENCLGCSGDEEQVLRILNNISTLLIVIHIPSCRQNFPLSKFTFTYNWAIFLCVQM